MEKVYLAQTISFEITLAWSSYYVGAQNAKIFVCVIAIHNKGEPRIVMHHKVLPLFLHIFFFSIVLLVYFYSTDLLKRNLSNR